MSRPKINPKDLPGAVCAYVEGESMEDIAVMLGCAPATARHRVHAYVMASGNRDLVASYNRRAKSALHNGTQALTPAKSRAARERGAWKRAAKLAEAHMGDPPEGELAAEERNPGTNQVPKRDARKAGLAGVALAGTDGRPTMAERGRLGREKQRRRLVDEVNRRISTHEPPPPEDLMALKHEKLHKDLPGVRATKSVRSKEGNAGVCLSKTAPPDGTRPCVLPVGHAGKCVAISGAAVRRVDEINPRPEPPEPSPLVVRACRWLAVVGEMLIKKNAAANPMRVFARDLDATAQLRVRIDDKLSRLARGAGIAEDEDTLRDLVGYLALYAAKLEEEKGAP